MSRPQFEPGKTMTACFMSGALHPVILDHRIGEQLAAHLVDPRVGGVVGDVEFDQPAGAHIVYAIDAEARPRAVEDRKGAGYGQSVSVRVDPACSRIHKNTH